MKHTVLLAHLIFFSIFFSCQTAKLKDSKDEGWSGIYMGILACADCEGVYTTLELKKDMSYRLSREYLGGNKKSMSREGQFNWSGDSIVVLADINPGSAPLRFLLQDSKLTQLDERGKAGSDDRYVLYKKDDRLTDKYWKLVSLRGEAVTASERSRREPHMILHSHDKSVTGNGGCNAFRGIFELSDENGISISKLSSTKMACGTMNIENSFLESLTHASDYVMASDTLKLTGPSDEPIATFVVVYLR